MASEELLTETRDLLARFIAIEEKREEQSKRSMRGHKALMRKTNSNLRKSMTAQLIALGVDDVHAKMSQEELELRLESAQIESRKRTEESKARLVALQAELLLEIHKQNALLERICERISA